MDELAPEVLLAALTAGLAVYGLLPDERRLRLHLRMHVLDWTVLGLTLTLVHYILFFPVLHELGWTLPLGKWRWGFTPALASYGLLLTALLFIVVRTSHSRLSPRKFSTFGRLLEQLQHEGRYAELFFLLESHLDEFAKTATSWAGSGSHRSRER